MTRSTKHDNKNDETKGGPSSRKGTPRRSASAAALGAARLRGGIVAGLGAVGAVLWSVRGFADGSHDHILYAALCLVVVAAGVLDLLGLFVASDRRSARIRGGVLFGAGVVSTLLLMANGQQLPHGPLWGMLTLVVAAGGLLDLLGLLAEPAEQAVALDETAWGRRDGEPPWAAPKRTVPVAFCVLVGGGILFGYEALPVVTLAALLPLVVPALKRPGLLVAVIVCAVYLPMLGTYGLWDPWETHYAEVAREILARDDWISLWWAQENWFFSKPILIFWGEALTMGALGVDYLPDANPTHPEWAVRLPIFAMSLGALMAVYAAVARLFGRRAGAVTALVLAATPHFFFLAHQAITDMPFVANMTIAVAVLSLALSEDPDREVRRYRLGRITISGRELLIGAVVMTALPQALYLISCNVTMVEPFMFAWHADEFMYGSAGNHGVPGNAPVREARTYVQGALGQPTAQALVWLAGLAALVWLIRRERRAQSLYMFLFYYFCALAFMGKGLPGFGLPGLVSLLYLVASRRWNLLFDGRLRIAAGALIIAVVGLPWYVAMYMRHGAAFTDRLFVHDHINRLAAGVHGDEGSISYFITQLGYATFPWVALVPAAVVSWLWLRRPGVPSVVPQPSVGAARASDDPAWTGEVEELDYHRAQTLTLLAVWFFAAFTLFSAMITKFHHYIFPAVPPAAILAGILLERMFGNEPRGDVLRRAGTTIVAAVAPVLLVLGVAGLYGDVRGVIPEGVEKAAMESWVLDHGWNALLSRTLVVVGALALTAAAWMWGPPEHEPALEGGPPQRRMLLIAAFAAAAVGLVGGVWLVLGAAVLLGVMFAISRRHGGARGLSLAEGSALGAALAAGAVLVAFVGRDLSWETAARPQGYERLIHLFVYNYGRPWPEHLDYRPVLTGFGIVATVLFGMAVFHRLRPLVSRALLGFGLCFAVWAVNVYLIDLSPHWGQRELIKTYYEQRAGPEEPLVAWQMNWKGENFYTGNRVSVFVDLDNKKVREWIGDNRGTHAYFILQHTRLSRLRNLLSGRDVREVTTKRDNNKFVLVEAKL